MTDLFSRLNLSQNAKFIGNILLRPVFYSTRVSEPLRILFCGSDEFSSASLISLKEEKTKNPDLIRSIDVLCRPAKKVGRGMKKFAEGK